MNPSEVRDNVARVRERIARAAARAGRDPAGIRLVAATKAQPPHLIEAAIAAGVEDVGENYVQEAQRKRGDVSTPARWHLIGHLQRNKTTRAAQVFDVIQTLDRIDVARALAARRLPGAPPLPVLIQVNVAGEPSKAGVGVAEAATLAEDVRKVAGLHLAGLMTIPPHGPPEAARPHFVALRRLAEGLGLRELSMGMSADLEVAIEEGATMVRIGRAIFGERG